MEFNKNDWKDPKYALLLAGILAIGAIIIVSILRERFVSNPQWQINVAGQGRIAYQPDTAKISLGVKVDRAVKAEDALKQLNDKMNKVIDTIKKAGVAPEDIQTQNYSLVPHYDAKDGASKLSGYDAEQTVVVKIEDIQKNSALISKVVSEATKAGANQINNVVFENADISKLKQEARLKAIADARSKSAEISTALGVELGDIVGWWENIISPAEGIYGGMDGKGGGSDTAGTPAIPAGTQEIVIEVNISYQID